MVLDGRMDAFRAGSVLPQCAASIWPQGPIGRSRGRLHFFAEVTEADLTAFSGPHPAGNVGVQIHEVAP